MTASSRWVVAVIAHRRRRCGIERVVFGLDRSVFAGVTVVGVALRDDPFQFVFAGGGDHWNDWIVWPLIAWVFVMAVRAYAVFVRRPASEAEIEREINRIRQAQ